MNNNPATGAITPRTRCGTTWPQVTLVIADFLFTGLLVHEGRDVESAGATAASLTAIVLLLTSIRTSGVRVLVTRLTSLQQEPTPGLL